MGDKPCFRCKTAKRRANGWCRDCEREYRREFHKKHRDKILIKKKAYFFKISVEEATRLSEKTSCDICEIPCKVVIDHDHVTGKVRGTLCNRCNLFLGKLEKHRGNLAKFLSYLNRSRNERTKETLAASEARTPG